MINQLSDMSSDIVFDYQPLSLESVQLQDKQLEQARDMALAISNESRQWQAYLDGLALFGLKEWLQDWSQNLALNWQNCSLLQPEYYNWIDGVFNLEIGNIKVSILAIGASNDDTVDIPRSLVDIAQFNSHFYIIMQVFEELQEVAFRAFLPCDRMKTLISTLQPEPNWTYILPLDSFNSSPDEFLLNLQHLKLENLMLPQIKPLNYPQISQVKAAIEAILPQIKANQNALWEVLTWEQFAVILTNYNLLIWFNQQLATNPQLITNFREAIEQSIINVGLWLRDEIDELAQNLSWVLLPEMTTEAIALRSPQQELQVFLQQFKRNGKVIPQQARSAYTDFLLNMIPLRLYAITWSDLSPESVPIWSLLLILGTQPGTLNLKEDIKLSLSDVRGVLLEKELTANTPEQSIYAHVNGSWEESFIIKISTSKGIALTFPAFAFRP